MRQFVRQILRNNLDERLAHLRRKSLVICRAEPLHESLAPLLRQISEQVGLIHQVDRAAKPFIQLLLHVCPAGLRLFDARRAGQNHAPDQFGIGRRQKNRNSRAEGMGDDVARRQIQPADDLRGHLHVIRYAPRLRRRRALSVFPVSGKINSRHAHLSA